MASAVKTNRPVDSRRAVRPQGARVPGDVPSASALVARSARYGTGAMARRRGVVPVPGKTGLLARIQNALSPAEVQARLFSVLKAGSIPSLSAFSSAIPEALIRVVVRAYGRSVSTYFVNDGGAVPSRAAASGATASLVDKAVAGSRLGAENARSKVAENGAISEYRNVARDGTIPSPKASEEPYTPSENRQIAAGLRDNRNWTELMLWLGAPTANIPPRLRNIQGKLTERGDRHSWSVLDDNGRKISVAMDSGLHLVVASGYASDGSKATGGAGSRTTFMGRRVDVLSADPVANRLMLETLSKEWGLVLAADYGVPAGSGRKALENAVSERMCPVDIAEDGTPRARLIYDPAMRARTNVILASERLGFRDMGMANNGKPSPMHPDRLEATFTEGYLRREVDQPGGKALQDVALRGGIGLMEAAAAITAGRGEKLGLQPADARAAESYVQEARTSASYDSWANEMAARAAPKLPRPARQNSMPVIIQQEAFGLEFGETCTGVNPSNTAIVFHNARSSRFTLVNRATGEELSGVPAKLGVSNLPIGNYMRLNIAEFSAWQSQGSDMAKRMSLGDAACGRTATVMADGMLSHYDGQGRLHNPLNGASVVRALKGEDGRDATPEDVSWHHEGKPMPKADFHALRTSITSEANALEKEPEAPQLDDPFGLRTEARIPKYA